jgi:hypothetical protein
MPINLDDQELAAVLAGLRMVQQALDRYGVLPYGIMDIYTNGGPGLTIPQIDLLCRRLNAGDGRSARHATSHTHADGLSPWQP